MRGYEYRLIATMSGNIFEESLCELGKAGFRVVSYSPAIDQDSSRIPSSKMIFSALLERKLPKTPSEEAAA